MEKNKFGLTLSGGGVRGLAHVGVIRALEERDIEVSILSGASAGSIVGSLYAFGMGPDEMLDFFDSTDIFSWQNLTWMKPGLIDTENLYQSFLDTFQEDDFSVLKKELYIVTTDILHGRPRIFHEGPMIRAILASAAFPGVLSPVEIDKCLYADGGIVNNFPIDLIRDKCETLVGVYVSAPKVYTMEELDSSLDIMMRAYHLMIAHQSLRKLNMVDIPITPAKLDQYNTFDTRHLKKIHDIGYEEACRVLDDWLHHR